MESLRNLPPAASFTDRKGQASVKVVQRNDTIYVDAVCDSLVLQCELYEKELVRVRGDTLKEVEKVRSNAVQTLFIGFLIGVLLCVVIKVIIQKIRK